jgi:hypothetical protein
MIQSDTELRATLDRIARFQAQILRLRQTETNLVNYRDSSSGFLAELDRMQLAVREYFSIPPTDLASLALQGIPFSVAGPATSR